MNVMLVEDERIIALQFSHALAASGCRVTVAHSGEAAVARLAENGPGELPDLLLMDILLGGEMDGIETAAVIRDRYAIPIIYVTASTDPVTLRRADASGHDGLLTKPIDPDVLVETVRRRLTAPA
ncbi:response regulator receiver protein [Desulfovibrio sp. X2]|uniref:response regulator n=1 Tax=Desulfovibrio sp. X2 TaxID=941449 RepID=UPI0003587942|nr:response regulator [Desulfovibrio sp. X2]EPR44036.1 response regulator receiver protein [Desulfovibrio sp. X2]